MYGYMPKFTCDTGLFLVTQQVRRNVSVSTFFLAELCPAVPETLHRQEEKGYRMKEKTASEN